MIKPLGFLQVGRDYICLPSIKMTFSIASAPPANHRLQPDRTVCHTQWQELTKKPRETDAFSIMQGLYFSLNVPFFPPHGKRVKVFGEGEKYKFYCLLFFLNGISSNLKSVRSLSSTLLRETEPDQIQTSFSHGHIFCNWKCQGDKRSRLVRINCSGWKDVTLLTQSSSSYPRYCIGVTCRLDRNATIKWKPNGTSWEMSSKCYFSTICENRMWGCHCGPACHTLSWMAW